MTVSPDGSMVVVGDKNDVITFIDTSTGKVLEELSGRQLAPKGIEVGATHLAQWTTYLTYISDQRVQVLEFRRFPVHLARRWLNTHVRSADVRAISQGCSTSSTVFFDRRRPERAVGAQTA